MSIIVGIILGAVITTLYMLFVIHNERRQLTMLEDEINKLRKEKDILTRQEATTAAQLSAAEKALAEAKEQASKDMQSQQKLLEAQLQSMREGMRAQFEKEMLERSEQLKKANTENMQQALLQLQPPP